jgi:hypothetical protein
MVMDTETIIINKGDNNEYIKHKISNSSFHIMTICSHAFSSMLNVIGRTFDNITIRVSSDGIELIKWSGFKAFPQIMWFCDFIPFIKKDKFEIFNFNFNDPFIFEFDTKELSSINKYITKQSYVYAVGHTDGNIEFIIENSRKRGKEINYTSIKFMKK